jgi:hypothetical protein
VTLHDGTSTGEDPAVDHSIADTLRLIDSIRAIAFDRTLTPIEALGRIRDLFRDRDSAEPLL